MTARRREPKKHQFGKAQGIREAVEMNTLGFCHLIYSVLGIAQAFDQIFFFFFLNCFAAAPAGTLKGRK